MIDDELIRLFLYHSIGAADESDVSISRQTTDIRHNSGKTDKQAMFFETTTTAYLR